MKITKNEVEYVAKLARLQLTEQEKELFTGQLDNILEYMEKLNELDTSQVQPTSHVLALKNVMRDDVVKPSSSDLIESMLENAPQRSGQFYVVPKVID